MDIEPGRVRYVVVDCADPERLASFWGDLLGLDVAVRYAEDGYVTLRPSSPEAPSMTFQRVPEPKTVKNRLHLDVTVADLEKATSWVRSMGGSRVPGGDFDSGDYRWRVMADPEGNEFCLVPEDQ